MSNQTLSISNGPTKFDLMLSLLEQKVVTIEIQNDFGSIQYAKQKITVFALMAEDGSNESWLIQARIEESRRFNPGNERTLYFYYRSDSRKGTASFDKRMEIVNKKKFEVQKKKFEVNSNS